VVIWSAGFWLRLQQPIGSGSEFLQALGQWWGQTLIPSMWWPGVLVLGFGASAWLRRRSPQRADWKPRDGNRIPGGRAALAMGLVGMLCGLYLLIDPRWVLDVFFSGHAAPAAYRALTYTDAFRQYRAPFLFALIGLNIPLVITVIVNGRYSALTRRLETALAVATCAVMAWTILDGPVLISPVSDRAMKFSMALVIVFMLIKLGVDRYRSVTPAPSRRMQAE
jgi:hypothetical protein